MNENENTQLPVLNVENTSRPSKKWYLLILVPVFLIMFITVAIFILNLYKNENSTNIQNNQKPVDDKDVSIIPSTQIKQWASLITSEDIAPTRPYTSTPSQNRRGKRIDPIPTMEVLTSRKTS